MANQATASTDKVPIWQKATFGAGHLVLNLYPGALGFFSFFLLTAFGMDPFLAGLLGGLPRLFDAITDPIMGFVSDNTSSKWGRRRPYIFVGAILSAITFILLWQLNENNSSSYNFWYFLIMSLVFLVGNTMFATPLVGLGYEMTSDYNERTRLMAFSQTVGLIAWVIVPWFWVIIADPDVFSNQATGVRKMALYVGIACLFLGLLPAIFNRGIDSANMGDRKKISFSSLFTNLRDLVKSIGEAVKNKPFVKLCGATFLVFNGYQIVASFSFFIFVFYIFNGDYGVTGTWPAWFASIGALISAIVVIPIVSWMATKWGKKKAFIISTGISIVGYILKWWGFDTSLNNSFNDTSIGTSINNAVGKLFETLSPFFESIGMGWFNIDTSQGGPWLAFLPIPLMSFGLGSLFTLMMSMTADVCDLDELENGVPRKEGTFGALYWWVVKLGQGLALVLGGLVLKLIGFDGNAATQATETLTKLRLADIIIPVVTAGLAMWVMWSYNLSEERAIEIKKELEELRGKL